MVWLFLAAAGMLFWNLHKVPLFEPDEGRYAGIAAAMVRTGDWITPHMNGLIHLHKPPFSSWLVALSIKCLGPSEFSTRLPGVLLSLLIIFGVTRLGRFFYDERAGVYAGWVLLTSVLYFVTSRLVTTDIVLSFFLFAAMSAQAVLFFGHSRRLAAFYLLMISLGLAMLTKGPVALMIALTPAVIFAVWKKRGWGIPAKHWALGLVIMAAISLSWYLIICIKHSGAMQYFLGDQLAGRMMKKGAGHRYPVYYYLIVLPLGFLPWTLSIKDSFAFAFRQKEDSVMKEKTQFLFLWFLVPFFLFSIISTKLATYIVPLFPALALLTGRFWSDFNANPGNRLSQTAKILFGVLASLPALIFIAGLIFIFCFPQFTQGIPPSFFALAGAAFIAISFLMFSALRDGRHRDLFGLQIGFMMIAALIGLSALPKIEFENSKAFAMKILELRGLGDKVIMYDDDFSSLPFYLGERIINVGRDPETRFNSPEEYKDYLFFEDVQILPFLKSHNRVFVMTTRRGLKKINTYTQSPYLEFWNAPLYVLMSRGDSILLSNQP